MVYILTNHCAGGNFIENEKRVKEKFAGELVEIYHCAEVDDKRGFLENITESDTLVIIGGDGTLNRFVNSIDNVDYPFPIYCYAGGTGNDFLHDTAGDSNGFIKINEYIKDLPRLYVNGKDYAFVNGVGFGLDGYCCYMGDLSRKKNGKNPNYLKFALKGLLGGFKPRRARVTIDGVVREYENVWFTSVMQGRFYGGSMMIVPTQDRLNPEKKISFAVAHTKSRTSILTKLPTVYKGKHVKFKKVFEIIEGYDIKVEFDSPSPMQIDGEPIESATFFEAKSYAVISGDNK
jgi:diacylglycerol kinase family enzyme